MCGSLSVFALGVVLCAAAPRQSVRETQRHIDVIERRVADAMGRGSRADAAAVERLFAERKASLEALLSRQFDPDGAISAESLTPAALVCERLMDYERTIDFATRALERDAAEAEAIFPLVRALLNTGRVGEARTALERSSSILEPLSRVRGLYGVLARFQGRRDLHSEAADSLDKYLKYRYHLLAAGDEELINLGARLVALRAHCKEAEGATGSFARLVSSYRSILTDAIDQEQTRACAGFSLSQRTAIRIAELELEASAGAGLEGPMCRALDMFLAVDPEARDDEWCAAATRYLEHALKLRGQERVPVEVEALLHRLHIPSNAEGHVAQSPLRKRLEKRLGEALNMSLD